MKANTAAKNADAATKRADDAASSAQKVASDVQKKLDNGEFVGAQGPKGETGATGPQGPKGKDGEVTFESLTDEQKASLRGEPGAKGEKGEKGEPGAQGPKGESGQPRKLTFSLPVSAWTGESAFSAEIAESSVTAQTWIEIAPDAASEENYSKDIIWETSAGRIALTTTAKPTGTLAGTMILTEVEG